MKLIMLSEVKQINRSPVDKASEVLKANLASNTLANPETIGE